MAAVTKPRSRRGLTAVGQSDTFFIPERRARSPAAVTMVGAVRDALTNWERQQNTRRRVRRPSDQGRHDAMVEALVCNAIHTWLTRPRATVALSLGKARKSRYTPPPYAPMKTLLTHLGEDGLGFLAVEWGGRPEEGPGRTTTFSATPRLLALAPGLTLADFARRSGGEPIVLRNTKARVLENAAEGEVADAFELWAATRVEAGELVSYKDNAVATRLRHEMHSINAALDRADFTFDASAAAPLGHLDQVDTGDRWLRRMFNNGFTDMRHGGRLAGGWWMDLPSDVRLRAIKIGGEDVAELDYRAMMPRLLYAYTRNAFPAGIDPYAIAGIPAAHRDGVKKLFASLMFGRAALKKWPRGCRRLFPPHMSHNTAVQLLRRQHAPVAECFGTIVGFTLLRTESDILVRVLLTSLRQGFIVLPIHDAVLCPASRAGETERIMLDAFLHETGARGYVSIHVSNDSNLVEP